jgi:hypothetical protein
MLFISLRTQIGMFFFRRGIISCEFPGEMCEMRRRVRVRVKKVLSCSDLLLYTLLWFGKRTRTNVWLDAITYIKYKEHEGGSLLSLRPISREIAVHHVINSPRKILLYLFFMGVNKVGVITTFRIKFLLKYLILANGNKCVRHLSQPRAFITSLFRNTVARCWFIEVAIGIIHDKSLL